MNTIELDGQFVVGTTCRRRSRSERKVTDDTSHRVKVSRTSPVSPVIAAVPAKRPGCSVRRTPSGNRIGEVRCRIYDADYEVVWDNLDRHTCTEVSAFHQANTTWLRVIQLPSYAPQPAGARTGRPRRAHFPDVAGATSVAATYKGEFAQER